EGARRGGFAAAAGGTAHRVKRASSRLHTRSMSVGLCEGGCHGRCRNVASCSSRPWGARQWTFGWPAASFGRLASRRRFRMNRKMWLRSGIAAGAAGFALVAAGVVAQTGAQQEGRPGMQQHQPGQMGDRPDHIMLNTDDLEWKK